MGKGAMKNSRVGIFFLIFALVYLFGTCRITSFSPFGNRGLDSQSIPRMLGVLMFALAVLQIIITVQHSKLEFKKIASSQQERSCGICWDVSAQGKDANSVKIAIFGTIGMLIAYVTFYNWLGFILSTVLYLIFSITLLTPSCKRRKMVLFIILFSVVFTLAIHSIFTKYLMLLLPQGIFL